MRYDNAEHFKKENGYEVGGTWYPRVTRILEVKAKPGLQVFFKEMGSFDAAEDVKNKSAEEGSAVHEAIQKLLVGKKVAVPREIEPSVNKFLEYNLQTAAYIQALQELEIKKSLALPKEIQTRWILRINQHKVCKKCNSTLREKGGRSKTRNGKSNGTPRCIDAEHDWGEPEGDVELKEFPYYFKDVRAFLAAKILWEWDNDYWLRQIGYSR